MGRNERLEAKKPWWEIHQLGVGKVKQWASTNGLRLYFEGHQFVDLIFKDANGEYHVVEVKSGKAGPNANQEMILTMFRELGAHTYLAVFDVDKDSISVEPFPAMRHE
jgi:hypothetical protein